jgi:YHS domain-containing protein
MFQFILLAAIIYVLYKWLRPGTPKPRGGGPPPNSATGPFGRSAGPVEEMRQDPVCGTWVPVSQAVTLKRDSQILFFCSPECRDKFLAGQGRK